MLPPRRGTLKRHRRSPPKRQDPDSGNAYYPKTLHKYLYAGGDPVNASDPTGRDIFEDLEIRAHLFSQITVPGYIQEIGAVKLIGSAGGLAALASAAISAYLEATDAEELPGQNISDFPVMTAPHPSPDQLRPPSPPCNEQPHPAVGGPGAGGNGGPVGAPGGGEGEE
jgi:hypothetical protein